LELEEQVDIEPVPFPTLPAQAPDHVAVAFPEAVADEARLHRLQGPEIEILDPGLVDETPQELLDHDPVREEKLVAAVVFHRSLQNWPRRPF
jgi:hypothetical protein